MLSSGGKAKRCLNLKKSHSEEEHSFSVIGYCLEVVKFYKSITINLQKRYIRQGQPHGKMKSVQVLQNDLETVN